MRMDQASSSVLGSVVYSAEKVEGCETHYAGLGRGVCRSFCDPQSAIDAFSCSITRRPPLLP